MNTKIDAAIANAIGLIRYDFSSDELSALEGFGHSANDGRGDTLQDVTDGNVYIIEAMDVMGLLPEGQPIDTDAANTIATALDEWIVSL